MADIPAEIPDKIFTYAFSGRETWRRHRGNGMDTLRNLYFLFRDTLKAENAKRLLQSPALDAFFPVLRFGFNTQQGYTITDDINIMSPGFTEGKAQRVPAVIDGEYKLMYPKTIQDACTLPHKLILGCSECLNEVENPELHCEIKKIYQAQKTQRVPSEIMDTLERWKHLKMQLEGYTFISPIYTAGQTSFSSRRLAVGSVNFDAIDRNIEARKEAAQSRVQKDRFRKNVCGICLVNHCCPNDRSRWCEGAYDKSEDAYYEHILEVCNIPYTNAQLAYLLKNSGRLSSYFQGKEHYLTFRYRDGLQYMLGNMRTGEERPMTYKQAQEIIQKCGYGTSYPEKLRITKRLKALLAVVSSFSQSPTMGSGWHKTSYAARYTRYEDDGFRQYFYYKRSNEIASWSFYVKDLTDVYRSHGRIPFVSKTVSPLSSVNRTPYDTIKSY